MLHNYKILSFVFFIAIQLTSAQVIQETRPSKEKWDLVTAEGTVTKINKETREITIRGPEGNLNTIKVSDQITKKKFDKIAVNDKVSFEYWTYVRAEFREPTLAERAEPLQIVSEGGRTPEGAAPGAVIGAIAKAIVTVEILNRPYMMATVRGPQGNYMTMPVEDPKILETVRIGQEFILIYGEAIAVSLEKVTQK